MSEASDHGDSLCLEPGVVFCASEHPGRQPIAPTCLECLPECSPRAGRLQDRVPRLPSEAVGVCSVSLRAFGPCSSASGSLSRAGPCVLGSSALRVSPWGYLRPKFPSRRQNMSLAG